MQYIYFGSGEFDGQGSGHDFSGNVRARSPLGLRVHPCVMSLRAVSQRTGVCKGVEMTRSCVCVYRTGTPDALQGHVHHYTSLLLAVVAVGVRAGAVAVVDESEGGVPYKASGSREAQLGHSGIIFSFNNSFISLHK